MRCRVLTWNLFHGRDRAPHSSLHSWRSRLIGTSERDRTHSQVNRDLFDEFAGVLAGAEWEVALLQEVPPRWAEDLAIACAAEPHLVLTSRNLPGPLGRAQAAVARFNPDLIASWEGGSNLTLVRGRARVARRSEETLARVPEMRRMVFTELGSGLCIANLHASEERAAAELDVAHAAQTAAAWAGERPLVFGGDLNLRPASSQELFAALGSEYGLSGETAPDAIDHLLSRGVERLEPAFRWPPDRREVPDRDDTRGRAIRLSDHAPVELIVEAPGSGA